MKAQTKTAAAASTDNQSDKLNIPDAQTTGTKLTAAVTGGTPAAAPAVPVIPAELVERVKTAAAAVRASYAGFLEAAHACGSALLEAKRFVPHGAKAKWYLETFGISDATAHQYQKIAEVPLEKLKAAGATTLTQALTVARGGKVDRKNKRKATAARTPTQVIERTWKTLEVSIKATTPEEKPKVMAELIRLKGKIDAALSALAAQDAKQAA